MMTSLSNNGAALTPPTEYRPQRGDDEKSLLAKMLSSANSLTVPPHDYIALTYIGSTNNVSTAVFKQGGSGGTTVATLTMTYVGAGASDNDKVATVTRS